MEYFGVYRIARSHVIPDVGHITWGNAKGQTLTRETIGRFVNNLPGKLPDEPTQSTRSRFAEVGGSACCQFKPQRAWTWKA